MGETLADEDGTGGSGLSLWSLGEFLHRVSSRTWTTATIDETVCSVQARLSLPKLSDSDGPCDEHVTMLPQSSAAGERVLLRKRR